MNKFFEELNLELRSAAIALSRVFWTGAYLAALIFLVIYFGRSW